MLSWKGKIGTSTLLHVWRELCSSTHKAASCEHVLAVQSGAQALRRARNICWNSQQQPVDIPTTYNDVHQPGNLKQTRQYSERACHYNYERDRCSCLGSTLPNCGTASPPQRRRLSEDRRRVPERIPSSASTLKEQIEREQCVSV